MHYKCQEDKVDIVNVPKLHNMQRWITKLSSTNENIICLLKVTRITIYNSKQPFKQHHINIAHTVKKSKLERKKIFFFLKTNPCRSIEEY